MGNGKANKKKNASFVRGLEGVVREGKSVPPDDHLPSQGKLIDGKW